MIKNFLFDLDNTIYPSSSKINEGIDLRMVEAVSEFLHIDMETAKKMRHEKKKNYSSTLEWLMKEQNFTDIDWYLKKVHPESEIEELSPVPGLKELFESFSQAGISMSILTNGPDFHARRVLEYYGIENYFSSIHDIKENNMHGKPYANAYFSALERENYKFEETLFIDDYPKYVAGYLELDGKAVLIDREGRFSDFSFPCKGELFRLKSVFELKNFF